MQRNVNQKQMSFKLEPCELKFLNYGVLFDLQSLFSSSVVDFAMNFNGENWVSTHRIFSVVYHYTFSSIPLSHFSQQRVPFLFPD